MLGDAAGHGEVAALEAALLALAVVACCRGGSLTAQNMEQLNTFLFARIELHRFVAAVVAEINWASGELRWLNAGLPAVLLFNPGQPPQSYPSSSYPFGVCSNLPATTIHRVAMDRCLQLLIHSDGMTEVKRRNSCCRRRLAAVKQTRWPVAAACARRILPCLIPARLVMICLVSRSHYRPSEAGRHEPL
ncbi:SpoIIE family protein phosphatase [Paludibacterium denitrificans]|uniref:SpoIIE family protein phosphatase n=1 Tax=Paludibacterium denitrificans TaxID=2675226 RepID=UPI001E335191|nr:SpoIIE family protein phosphatase [Paludibacterium denitrificans]